MINGAIRKALKVAQGETETPYAPRPFMPPAPPARSKSATLKGKDRRKFEDGGPADKKEKKEYKPFGVLPFREDESGIHFDSDAGLLGSVKRAVTLPGDVVRGKVDPMSDEGIRRTVDLAGTMTLGSGAIPVEANALNSGIRVYPLSDDIQQALRISRGERGVVPSRLRPLENEDAKMAILHGLGSNKIHNMLRYGWKGLPSPSLAIAKPDSGLNELANFGPVYLVGKQPLAHPSETNPIVGNDMWSPRVPGIKRTPVDSHDFSFETINPDTGEKILTPATPENIVEHMGKRPLIGGEGGELSIGGPHYRVVKSQLAPRFKTFEEIQQARGKLAGEPDADLGYYYSTNDLSHASLAEQLYNYAHPQRLREPSVEASEGVSLFKPRESDAANDLLLSAMADRGETGGKNWDAHYRDVPDDLMRRYMQYEQDIADEPVNYFEAKPQRVVNFNEFAGAIIPKKPAYSWHPEETYDPAKTADQLRQLGIDNVQHYNDEADYGLRNAIRRYFKEHLFHDGGSVEDALRIAKNRPGYAEGGPADMPETWHDKQLPQVSKTILDVSRQAAEKYPFINKFDPRTKISPRSNVGFAETFLPDDEGDVAHGQARPKEFPMSSTGIEIYRPREFTADDYAGEFLHRDPRAHDTRAQLRKSFTPRQLDIMQSEPDYVDSIKKYHMSPDDAMRNMTDAVMRGYTVGQWPQSAIEDFQFTKDQQKLLDDLKDYMRTDKVRKRAMGGRTPAWQRSEGKNPKGGLNAKGRASAKAEGHNLKPPAPHPKTDAAAARRKSFCSRMKGMKAKLTSSETANDPDSRINKSLRAWNCRADGGRLMDDDIMNALRIANNRRFYDNGGTVDDQQNSTVGSADVSGNDQDYSDYINQMLTSLTNNSNFNTPTAMVAPQAATAPQTSTPQFGMPNVGMGGAPGAAPQAGQQTNANPMVSDFTSKLANAGFNTQQIGSIMQILQGGQQAQDGNRPFAPAPIPSSQGPQMPGQGGMQMPGQGMPAMGGFPTGSGLKSGPSLAGPGVMPPAQTPAANQPAQPAPQPPQTPTS